MRNRRPVSIFARQLSAYSQHLLSNTNHPLTRHLLSGEASEKSAEKHRGDIGPYPTGYLDGRDYRLPASMAGIWDSGGIQDCRNGGPGSRRNYRLPVSMAGTWDSGGIQSYRNGRPEVQTSIGQVRPCRGDRDLERESTAKIGTAVPFRRLERLRRVLSCSYTMSGTTCLVGYSIRLVGIDARDLVRHDRL